MINGGYYPNGGIHSISKALYKLCKDVGVDLNLIIKLIKSNMKITYLKFTQIMKFLILNILFRT